MLHNIQNFIFCSCSLDLLTVEPHTPTPYPVEYDKKDGQWYTHDGVDVAETQSRKGGNELNFWLSAYYNVHVVVCCSLHGH